MVTLAVALVLGQITFVERPLPDLVIGNVTPFTGRVSTNFMHADVDYDGDSDLILPRGLYLQERGVYGDTPWKSLPRFLQDVEVDSYGGKLYCHGRDRISVYSFEDGVWKVILEQVLSLPGADKEFEGGAPGQPSIRFRRFLHDLNGDDIPELVSIDHRGVHLFRLDAGRYLPAGTLELPAQVSISRLESQSIWPKEARRLMFPEQQMSFRLVFDGQILRTVSVQERRKDMTRYTIQSRTLTVSDDGTYHVGERHDTLSGSLPAHLRPCRLNDDAQLDFAGGRWLRSETSPVPTPLYELWATLDGGVTFSVRRTAAYAQFRPHCAFVDFDGDGDMDMVTESTRWPRGSVREQLTQFLTEARVEHVVHIYVQKDGKYSSQPKIQHTVNIELEAPPAQQGAMISRYKAGSLVSITGDFNADGYRDLLVRSSPERLDVFLAEGWKGLSKKPAWSRVISRDVDAYVADINDDGLSDIYLRSQHRPPEGEPYPGTVCYAQRGVR